MAEEIVEHVEVVDGELQDGGVVWEKWYDDRRGQIVYRIVIDDAVLKRMSQAERSELEFWFSCLWSRLRQYA